ncbi:MAG: FAD:protein FMN transferase [Calditrichaeota bacterium]|nr:FAD:protein FMN transferase [Calditrichota bacterium]
MTCRNRIAAALAALLFVAAGCSRVPVSETRTLMGTQVTITVQDYDNDKLDGGQLPAAMDSAFVEIARIEDLARWDELKKLNAWAGYQAAPIGEELIGLIDRAYQIAENTGGAFRPDLGPLTNLWGIGTDEARLPAYWEIEEALDLISQTVFTIEDSVYARLDPDGASLDLGGVAKGYAVDRACFVLDDLGVTAAMVEAGGDLRVFGRKPSREPWRIAVRHPRELDRFYTIIELHEGAVATSGDYERYFEVDGGRYHHIFDPETGYPSRASISATAIAETCAGADAYATAFFVLGPDAAVRLAGGLELPALVIDENDDGELVSRQTSSFARLRADERLDPER